MLRIIVIDSTGKEESIKTHSNVSLMVALRDNAPDMLDADFGQCGGCCSCCTCHVWIDETHVNRLPAPMPHEDELLEFTNQRRPTSRLGCQVELTTALDGLRILIPPAD